MNLTELSYLIFGALVGVVVAFIIAFEVGKIFGRIEIYKNIYGRIVKKEERKLDRIRLVAWIFLVFIVLGIVVFFIFQ